MSSNSIFKPRIVEQYMKAMIWPKDFGDKKAIVAHWVEVLQAGALKKMSESSLHADFLKDIFESVLDYPTVVTSEGTEWNLWPEKHTSPGGGTADAALGLFSGDASKIVAPVELKGVKDDLDRMQSRGYTPVQQGWRYASETPNCRWIVVSNYQLIRLYHVMMTPALYESFELEKLGDDREFRRFYFLLCRANFLPTGGASLLDRMLEATDHADKEVTQSLYAEYSKCRLGLLQHLVEKNPQRSRDELIGKTQKLLDRILFMSFCEDRGLLPQGLINQAHNLVAPGLSKWMSFKLLFHAIDKGDPPTNIQGYNGGLFAPDPALDSLVLDDAACGYFLVLSQYDYESEVSVNILGHIFEQSISDIEALKNGGSRPAGFRRKSEGIFYTPAQITRYIAEETIGEVLRRRLDELISLYKPEKVKSDKKRLALQKKVWEDYRSFLSAVKICDPACGSGAFLVAAFDCLLAEYERANSMIAELNPKDPGQLSLLFDLNKNILTQNLYGVDLNQESVEITKLSLWIKTAEKGKQLTDLDGHIRCGNSLIDDPTVDARAFNWKREFPDVFQVGGFHIILGNPPYIKLQNFKPSHVKQAEWIVTNYASARIGNFDMYLPFIERGLSLLNPKGVMGFIAPSLWLLNEYGAGLRKLLAADHRLSKWVDFKDYQVFSDATTYTALQFFNGSESAHIQHAVCPDGNLARLEWSITEYDDISGDSPWVFLPSDEADLIRRLDKSCEPLGEVAEGLIVGIQTSADDVYHLTKAGPGLYLSQALKGQVNIEDEIMKPLVSSGEAGWFAEPTTDTYLLFPYDLAGDHPRLLPSSDMSLRFPMAWAYLRSLEQRLRKRENGRFDKDDSWWQFGRNQNIDKQHRKKLGVPETVKTLQVFNDIHGKFCFNNVRVNGIIVREDDENLLWYLLGILNSPVANFVFRRKAKPKANGYYEANKQFIRTLPIPKASLQEMAAVGAMTKHLATLYGHWQSLRMTVEHRIEDDLLSGRKMPRVLQDWCSMTFAALRQELATRYGADIPLTERDDWEEYLATRRAMISVTKSRIVTLNAGLAAETYRLYGLTRDDVALVCRG